MHLQRSTSRISATLLTALALVCSPPTFAFAAQGQAASAVKNLPLLGVVSAFELTDQDGATFGPKQLRERPWIASFESGATPAVMARLQESLARNLAWPEIRLVSIELGLEQGKPAALKARATASHADAQHWHFLGGAGDSAARMMGAAGAQPGTLVLVDFYGRVRARHPASADAAAILRDFEQLLGERVPIPAEILQPPWLEPRRQAQLATAGQFTVEHGFRFTDKVEESGITFRNKLVDDAGKRYEMAHYDHGNGLAIADVDGDGRLDVYFLTQSEGNELWRNVGGGRFDPLTQLSPALALADRICVSASFGDIDNDGDPDLFVTSVRGGNALFENTGGGKFRDVTKDAGVGYVGHSSGAVFFDYDRDGRLDLFVTNVGVYTNDEVRRTTMEPLRGEEPGEYRYYHALPDAFGGHLKPERDEQSKLYRNTGGLRFQDVTLEAGLVDTCWSGDATPLDANEDGWPDLYVLNMQGHDEYFENQGGKRFERKSVARFPNTPWGSMGVKAMDFENDGRLDLFVTDMHSDMSVEIGPEAEKKKADIQWPPRFLQIGEFSPDPTRVPVYGNAFFKNEGNGKYSEISQSIGAENYWPWGLSAGDLNADGFEDVFITASMNFPFRYCVNTLLLNDQGKTFRDSEFLLGVEPRREGRTATMWFELDVDGPDKDFLQKEKWGLAGVRQIWSALGTKSSAIFDLDDDGDLDILTNEVNCEPMVLVSDLAAQRKDLAYLKVRLVGKTSNRDGLGALVRLRAGQRQWVKANDGCSGYLSHSLMPLYFGLTGVPALDSLEVTWPSGKTQKVAGPVKTNQLLVVAEE